MLARTTEIGSFEPSSLSRPVSAESAGRDQRPRVRMLRPAAVSGAEALEEACLDMNGIERNESDATTSEDEAGAHVCRKRRRIIASRTEETLLSGTSRSKELQSLLGGKQRARRGHTGR